jgi:hypothetical protein
MSCQGGDPRPFCWAHPICTIIVHCKICFYHIDLEHVSGLERSTAPAFKRFCGTLNPGLLMRRLAVMFCCALLAYGAQAQIYECVNPDGSKLLTNVKSQAKGCRQLDVGPINTVPSTKPVPGKGASPANFPKVDAETQKGRDTDRRRILERELTNEEQLLERARKDLAEQEAIRLGSERNYQRVLDRLEPYQKKVQLHEGNVANLKKELANLK